MFIDDNFISDVFWRGATFGLLSSFIVEGFSILFQALLEFIKNFIKKKKEGN